MVRQIAAVQVSAPGEPEDVVQEFWNLAIQMGSKVELISADSTEGKVLLAAFGGLAAILRYRIR
jgi:peptide chain release factor subunit 1